MKKGQISRRALLRGLGAGMAMLPLLQAEREGWAGPATFPKRLITVTWTNGIYQRNWLPTVDNLSAAPLPPILQPLEPWKSKILIPSGVDLKVMLDAGRTWDGHFSYPSLFTGTSPTASTNLAQGPSIDQIIGNHLREQGVSTPQLNLGCRTYGNSTTWAAAGQKNTSETNPYRLFDRLFGGASVPSTEMENLRKRRKSVLDAVGGELSSFAGRLGNDDKLKVQAHLDAVRMLELDLEAAASQGVCAPPSLGDGQVNFDNLEYFGTHTELMMKLAATAVKCDITRAVTLDVTDDGGGYAITFPWLELSSPDFHGIAHMGSTAAEQKTKIDRWFYQQLATLVKELADTPEGSGSALDNTVIVVTSDMNEGNVHGVFSIPFLLIGSCGGFFHTGRVVRFDKLPHNKLLTTLCHAMDVPVSSVGSTYTGDCDADLMA
jgi:Protein of unknown function (DUF1552)